MYNLVDFEVENFNLYVIQETQEYIIYLYLFSIVDKVHVLYVCE